VTDVTFQLSGRAQYAHNYRYERNFCGRCGPGTLTGMNTLQERTGPRVHVALSSGPRKTEVRIQVRLSGPAAARLLVVIVLVLTAAAVAAPAHTELARAVLCTLAGFLTGSRSRTRS
jgi:hypothetical protein